MTRLQAAAKGWRPALQQKPGPGDREKIHQTWNESDGKRVAGRIMVLGAGIMEDRGKLASQLVRCHALLWSIEDVKGKAAIRHRIREIEARIAQLDGLALAPPPPRPALTDRLGRPA